MLHQRVPVIADGAAKMAAALKSAKSISGVPGIDSLVNFTGSYQAQGSKWTYAMVGDSPSSKKGTVLGARGSTVVGFDA